jgi:hypothetical protein
MLRRPAGKNPGIGSLPRSRQEGIGPLRQPSYCPVCSSFEVKQILREGAICADTGFAKQNIYGLAGYICRQGHIFFVRACDLNSAPPPQVAFRYH